jgi:hypothetical protein
MPKKPNLTQKEKLHKLGIRNFDIPIHDQSKDWLIQHFSKGADEYPVNVALLMRNIIWQVRQRILRKDKPPLNELIRTFWYMFIKPTLSRANSLSRKPKHQYIQLIKEIVSLVKDWHLLEYKDFGFRDDKQYNRKVGSNYNIILFSEKLGHQEFLSTMADKFHTSILALGGQPSVMNTEYFVDELKKQKRDLRKTFHLFSIVDFDPSGWIIRDAFIDNLRHYGIKNIQCTDLIHPDMLTENEVKISRYRIPAKKSMLKKNQDWFKEVKKRKYKNYKYLVSERVLQRKIILYGLEAESISGKRLETKLDKLLSPLLEKKTRPMALEDILNDIKELIFLTMNLT